MDPIIIEQLAKEFVEKVAKGKIEGSSMGDLLFHLRNGGKIANNKIIEKTKLKR